MNLVSRPTLTGVDRSVDQAIKYLQDAVDTLSNQNELLRAQLAKVQAPMTPKQISFELSAAGSAPLNVTGLIGNLAPPPK